MGTSILKKYLGRRDGALRTTLIPKEAVSIYNAGTQCVQELFDGKRVFENVKPVNVIQYFINMAAKDGDIVMDFFSGSATTAHAVMQTEADKNIDLHYILVQIPQECDKKSEAYKAGYKTICEIGKERIAGGTEKNKTGKTDAKTEILDFVCCGLMKVIWRMFITCLKSIRRKCFADLRQILSLIVQT